MSDSSISKSPHPLPRPFESSHNHSSSFGSPGPIFSSHHLQVFQSPTLDLTDSVRSPAGSRDRSPISREKQPKSPLRIAATMSPRVKTPTFAGSPGVFIFSPSAAMSPKDACAKFSFTAPPSENVTLQFAPQSPVSLNSPAHDLEKSTVTMDSLLSPKSLNSDHRLSYLSPNATPRARTSKKRSSVFLAPQRKV